MFIRNSEDYYNEKALMKIIMDNPFIERYPELQEEEAIVRAHLLCSLGHERTKGLIKISRYYNNSFYYAVYGDSIEDCKMAISYTNKLVDAYNELIKLYPELKEIEWKLVIALVTGDHNPHIRDALERFEQKAYENILKILEDRTIIPDEVQNDINFLKETGKYDMESADEIISAANKRRLYDTANWLFNNKIALQKMIIEEELEKNRAKKEHINVHN